MIFAASLFSYIVVGLVLLLDWHCISILRRSFAHSDFTSQALDGMVWDGVQVEKGNEYTVRNAGNGDTRSAKIAVSLQYRSLYTLLLHSLFSFNCESCISLRDSAFF